MVENLDLNVIPTGRILLEESTCSKKSIFYACSSCETESIPPCSVQPDQERDGGLPLLYNYLFIAFCTKCVT